MTLSEYLQRLKEKSEELEEKTLLKLMKRLFEALQYLGSKNIAHKNINPKSIFVKDKQNPAFFISDFGITQCINNLNSDEELINRKYLSPEAYKDASLGDLKEYDPFKSDVFSLGIVLLECFSEERQGEMNQTKTKHQVELERLERKIKKNKEIFEIVKKMIEFEPIDRIGYDELLAQIYKKMSLNMIYLNLKDMTHKNIPIRVNEDKTIGHLFSKIEFETGAPRREIFVFYRFSEVGWKKITENDSYKPIKDYKEVFVKYPILELSLRFTTTQGEKWEE